MVITDLDYMYMYLALSVNGTSTEVIVNDLKPFRTYGIQIAAYTIGLGPYSDIVNSTLPESGIKKM